MMSEFRIQGEVNRVAPHPDCIVSYICSAGVASRGLVLIDVWRG